MLRSRSTLFSSTLLLLGLLGACPGEPLADFELSVPASLSGRVNEPVRTPVVVAGEDAYDLRAVYASSGGRPVSEEPQAGRDFWVRDGEFVFLPLASHTGSHIFRIELLVNLEVRTSAELQVQVDPATDAAPVFLSPREPGRTYNLLRDATVTFPVEVRDDDDLSVMIRSRVLPAGATLTMDGPKRAIFSWQPSNEQVNTQLRYPIEFEASDGSATVSKRFTIVLDPGSKDGCPGEPPVAMVSSPTAGARVGQRGGYLVQARVTDDVGLRAAPLLYYRTTDPGPSEIDVSAFQTVVMGPEGTDAALWEGRIPDLGLSPGEEQAVWVLVRAIDNDDTTGTACDLVGDSSVVRFVALGDQAGEAAECGVCTRSSECAAGASCTATPDGGRCLVPCGDGCERGSCAAQISVEGARFEGCGPVDDVCGDGGTTLACEDDEREEDDTPETAAAYEDGGIIGTLCDTAEGASDDDYVSFEATAGELIAVSLTGLEHDVDMELFSPAGSQLGRSAASGTSDESIMRCTGATGTHLVQLSGYAEAGRVQASPYLLEITRMPGDAGMCCVDDENEPDDTDDEAQLLDVAGLDSTRLGTACPGDDDWFAFEVVSTPSRVHIELVVDEPTQDLDMRLFDPDGAIIGLALNPAAALEEITETVMDPGFYYVRVNAYAEAASDYIIDVSLDSPGSCADDGDCPLEQYCDAGGSCTDRACSGEGSCPPGYGCPDLGPGAMGECGRSCTSDGECRVGESCKWFAEGRFCGREGTGALGDPCSTAADCGDGASCVDWDGGYCARRGCSRFQDCGAAITYEADCIAFPGGAPVATTCALTCSDEMPCRAGYACDDVRTVTGGLWSLCVPSE